MFSLDSPPLLLVAQLTLGFGSCYLLAVLVYRLYFSPLSHLPGPWYAAISDLWLLSQVIRFRQCFTVHKLFQTYGQIVRVGPNKVAFCDYATVKQVYAIGKFDKSVFYSSLQIDNHEQSMTALQRASHAKFRKAYVPHYTHANLAHFHPQIHALLKRLIHVLNEVNADGSVECLDFFRHFMVDVMSTTIFGIAPVAMDRWGKGVEDPICTAVFNFPKKCVLRSLLPRPVWNIAEKFPGEQWKTICDSEYILRSFVCNVISDLRQKGQGTETSKEGSIERTLLQCLDQADSLTNDNVLSEAMGHLIAGTDTTSLTVSYLLWELSSRPDIAKKLQAELDEALPDPSCIPAMMLLDQLPYFNSVVNECLRVYAAGPSLLERVVPEPSNPSEAFNAMGYQIPPGTVVATQIWSIHRDPSVFERPDEFLPERWLRTNDNEERLSRMHQSLSTFGLGSRPCAGMNLAQTALKWIISTVVRNFDITANPLETNEKTMNIKDVFVIIPASKECRLSFHPRCNNGPIRGDGK